MAYSVYIGGVEMTGDSHFVDEGSLEHVNAQGQRDTAGCRIVSKDGSYSPAIGATFEVYEDATLRFGGTIREANISLFGAAKIATVQCASWEQICDRRIVGQSSFDNNAGDIFTRLCIDYLAIEGITSSIVATGPPIKVSFDWCTVREAFDKICELASDGTDVYMWDVTPDKVARLFKQSSFAAPINVTDSSPTVLHPITLNQSFGGSGVGYANKIRVRVGRFITDPRVNEYDPDGSLDTLSFELPIAKVPTVTVGGATQTVGIRDLDTGKDCYWQDGSPDVTFAVNPSAHVVITAQGYQTTVIDAGQDNDEVTARSIAEDNSGWYEILVELSDGKTTSDALAAGAAALADRGKIPNAIEYPTTTSGVRAGQYQTINLSTFGVNATFIIESVRLFWAGPNYGWMVRAVNGALANGWLQKIRKIATGSTTGASGTGGTSISTGNTLALTPALSSGLVGVPYSGPLVATGGEPPYTFSIATGALPAWATLDAATGIISGTPTDVATTAFTARVTDTSTVTADADCSLIIADAGVSPNVAPDNVTIDSVTPDLGPTPIVNRRGISAGTQRGVELKYTPPDPIGTFLGVIGVAEAPDQSAAGSIPLDGSVNLGGGRRLGGPKDALPIGPFAHADVNGVFRFSVPEPRTYPMTCRVRLMSYSGTATNDADTSPSATFVIAEPTVGKPSAGTAYCQNPTAVTIISTSTPKRREGVLMRKVRVGMTPPEDPRFAGVQWIVKDAAGELINASGIQAETEFELVFQELTAPQTCTVYACGSDGVNINPLVEGITPSATVDIGTVDGTIDLGETVLSSLEGTDFEVVDKKFRIKGVDMTRAFNASTEFHIDPVTGKWSIANVDMSKAANLSAQFQWDAGASVEKIVNLDAGIIKTGRFQVGGGKVSLAKFFDTAGTPALIGFIGDDTTTADNPGGTGFVGAWFKRMGIGGTAPTAPRFFADSSGNVVASSVSIADATNAYGFIGAYTWFKNIGIGGTSGAPKILADSSGNLIISGSLISGNISGNAANITGTLSVSQIAAGGFTGRSVTINAVGVTTTLNNTAGYWGTAGLRIQNNGSSLGCTVEDAGFTQINSVGGIVAYVGSSGDSGVVRAYTGTGSGAEFDTNGAYKLGGSTIISFNGFGASISAHTTNSIVYKTGLSTGVSGTFTAGVKTVTVTNGIVTSIV